MKLFPTTSATLTMTFAAGLLTMLTACGGQPAQPVAVPTPTASTSAVAPSHSAAPGPAVTPTQSVTPGQPGSDTASPTRSAQVLSSRVAYPWHWPNDVAAPGRVTHARIAPMTSASVVMISK